MVCSGKRRDFSSSSLVAQPLGLSFGFSPTSACGPSIGVCSLPSQEGVEAVTGGALACFGGRGQRWRLTGMCEPTPAGTPPSASRGGGQSGGREAVMVALPFTCHSTMALHFHGGLGFLQEHSQMWSSSLPSPQAVSTQPTAVLSPGLLSKPYVPASSPRPHQQTHNSGWGMQGCVMDHQCRSHSVLPATDWLLCSPSGP